MAWTAPMTAIAGNAFTAAQFNTYVRDNLLETAPAKATAAGNIFVSTGTNAIAQRVPGSVSVSGSGTTSSSSYTSVLTGSTAPSVTVTTGEKAMVAISARVTSSNTSAVYFSYGVSGATTVAPSDSWSAFVSGSTNTMRIGASGIITGLTPGSNTFTMQYRATGSATGTYQLMNISVIPF